MSAIAAQSLNDPDRVGECIEKIQLSSRFLLGLINDILDMSRIESGKLLLNNGPLVTRRLIEGVSTLCAGQAAAKAFVTGVLSIRRCRRNTPAIQ